MPEKHLHVYKKVNIGARKFDSEKGKLIRNVHIVFKCIKAGCTHYITPELLRDRIAECCRCGAAFQVTSQTLRLTNLHCPGCSKDKKFMAAFDFVKGLEE